MKDAPEGKQPPPDLSPLAEEKRDASAQWFACAHAYAKVCDVVDGHSPSPCIRSSDTTCGTGWYP